MLMLKLQIEMNFLVFLILHLETFSYATSSGASLWKSENNGLMVSRSSAFHSMTSSPLSSGGEYLGSIVWWESDQRVAQDLGSSPKAVLVPPSMKISPLLQFSME